MRNASGRCAPAHAAAVCRRRQALHPSRREAARDAREHRGRRRHARGVRPEVPLQLLLHGVRPVGHPVEAGLGAYSGSASYGHALR
jgi:hypothetical protein